jgi:hypothetical protein
MSELGIDVFEAAAMFWGGGYDPAEDELTEEPFGEIVEFWTRDLAEPGATARELVPGYTEHQRPQPRHGVVVSPMVCP